MTASIREERKQKLSDLLSTAERGEEVIITSHGKPRARLVPIRPKQRAGGLNMTRLTKLAAKGWTGKSGPDGTQIISEQRDER